MLLIRLLCAAFLFAGWALAAGAPITHETIWLMKRVAAPVASPDGKWVVFQLTEPAYDEKDQWSDLWMVPADGSAKPRRLTFSKGAEAGAAWSPDSRRLAFSARREGDEAGQVYVIDVAAGGEAVRITSLSTGAGSPRWRPDGRALLFSSAVYPGAADDEANKKIAAERKARKYNARVYDTFPIRYWDHWLDDPQPHVFVQAAEPGPPDSGARPRDLLAGSKLVAEPGFAGASTPTGEELAAIWAPDGQSIVFVATTKKNATAYAHVNTHLFQVSADGGEPRQLTSGNDTFLRPAFRPDGKSLYCATQKQDTKVYHLDRLARIPWPAGGPAAVISEKFERSVGSFAFSPDGKMIYLIAEDAGYDKVFALPAGGGEAQVVAEAARGVYSGLSIPGRAPAPILVAAWESMVSPAEVVRIDPAGGRHKALTDFNSQRVAAIDWQPLREFWFTSKRGKRIHNFIALPPAFEESKKYPLVVLMHGGPASMWKDQFFLRWNYHLIAQPGYVVLMTNFTGSTGYGEKFAQDIQEDPFRGPGQEVNEAADEAIRRFPFIDAGRQAAGGASYGGHMANWLQATTTRYKCLFSHAGLVNAESQWGTSDIIYHRELMNGGPVWEQGPVWREQNPIRYAKNFRTPMLITVGEKDFRVPLNQSLENWSVLQRLRVPSRLIVFPDAGHWILRGDDSRFFYQQLHAWLKKWL